MFQREESCCFTGHRIISSKKIQELMKNLESIIRELIKEGIRYFYAGGALGFDMLAEETILRLRQEFSDIQLILVLPCRNQAERWKFKNIERYEAIKAQADKVIYISENYTPSCMHERNRYMVDHSSVCVAYCTRSEGGSAYTVNYAYKQGLRLIILGFDLSWEQKSLFNT